ncbi:unnamed protein product [Parnassius apollo]|uniref:(apollo) hypothetical protein n=1 Tax=Parnassius apollo TaxID=110799 RepID=A0A8S3WGL9_PARAO|nr:unnamed protein product [Parnassius apollo]
MSNLHNTSTTSEALTSLDLIEELTLPENPTNVTQDEFEKPRSDSIPELNDVFLINISEHTKLILQNLDGNRSVTRTNKDNIKKSLDEIKRSTQQLYDQVKTILRHSISSAENKTVSLIRNTIREEFSKLAVLPQKITTQPLQDLVKPSIIPSSLPSYAKVVKSTKSAEKQPIPVTKPAIIVSSKQQVSSSKETVNAWRNSIHFKKYTFNPSEVKLVSNHKIRVEFDNQEQRDETLNAINHPDSLVNADIAKKLKPLVILKGIYRDTPVSNVPTYETVTHKTHRESIIDLTMTFDSLSNKISNWKVVLDAIPSSNHNAITFDLSLSNNLLSKPKKLSTFKYNTQNIKWDEITEQFKCELGKYLDLNINVDNLNTSQLDKYITKLVTAVQKVSDKLFPRKSSKVTNRAPWWNDKLENLKQKVIKNHHKIQQMKRSKKTLTELLLEKENLRNEYAQAIRIASTEHFREFCNKQGKEDVWSITNRLLKTTPLKQPPSTLKTRAGKYTKTTYETAETFLNEYFPDDGPDTCLRHMQLRNSFNETPDTPADAPFTVEEVLDTILSQIIPLALRAKENATIYEIKKGKPIELLPGRQLEKRISPYDLPHPCERSQRSFGLISEQKDIDELSNDWEIKNIKYTQTQDTFDNTPSSLTLNLSEHLQPLTERLEAVSSELKTIRELQKKTPPPAISLSTELALAEMANSTKSIPTYTQKVKEKPVLRPNHTLFVSSTDPNKTGENVIETIRKALDIKRTGARVEKIRKARNRKVVLSCGTKEDLDLIRSQVKKNETLKAETPKMSNPLIKIKDVLSYHTDAEIVEQLGAQNKHLFQDLKATENVMRVRYRKRARNTHECHPIVELSPTLHRRFLEAEKIYIGLQRRPVEDQSPLVQCTKCLGFGHTKNICQEKENLCSYCGENHPWEKCTNRLEGKAPNCKNCLRAHGKNSVSPHNVFSNECPEKQKWDSIAREQGKGGVSIALVQEPYVGKSGEMKLTTGTKIIQCTLKRQKPVKAAIIIFDDRLGVIHDPQLVTETEVAVLLRAGKMRLGIVSVYYEGDQDIEPYLVRTKVACEKLQTENLLVGGDVNAWSHWWGSSHEDQRGAAYNAFLNEIELHILNTGDAPTFETYRGNKKYTSVVDVTACSLSLLGRIDG